MESICKRCGRKHSNYHWDVGEQKRVPTNFCSLSCYDRHLIYDDELLPREIKTKIAEQRKKKSSLTIKDEVKEIMKCMFKLGLI